MHAHDERTTTKKASQRGGPQRQSPAAGPVAGVPLDLLALQRSAGNAAAGRMLQRARSSAVHDVLAGPGRPLAEPLRAEMEARLDADFSDVRLHTGQAAQRSAEEIGARAYTSGSHIVIGDGGADKHTLAHELTHVIQQRQGPVAGTDRGNGLAVSDPGDRFERAAQANAGRVMSGPVPVREREPERDMGGLRADTGTGVLQRYYVDEELNVRFTRDEAYLIDGRDENYRALRLWVRTGATPPHYCKAEGKSREVNGNEYQSYVPNSKFYADCVQTAEEVMHGRRLALGGDEDAPIMSRFSRTGHDFGAGDEGEGGNVEGALEYAAGRRGKNSAAANRRERPAVSQAYAMVETAYRSDEDEEGNRSRIPANASGFPYHAAAVVAADGDDQITLEQTASTKDAGKRNANGWFSVYRVGDEHLSFYAQQKASFSKGAVAVVIEARPQPE